MLFSVDYFIIRYKVLVVDQFPGLVHDHILVRQKTELCWWSELGRVGVMMVEQGIGNFGDDFKCFGLLQYMFGYQILQFPMHCYCFSSKVRGVS